ncbi:hypothetical protein M0G43_06670 [Subsaxibacter sp. CAU 1640]|uniref:glycosyltransferase family 9 protein n=1 Tax=Subsaxibacter sp. CAU 1640 TaxID=2933271 RepID=UPI00200347F6|nr:glycosyltransferase family 9 protein [Subsaxibacter sp. CAU 1640]MCK7590249.1 hypothetical protein [Subsaxibacter sp. CAU 1640]
MKHIIFLHDTSLTTPRGAELTIKQLMEIGEHRNFRVSIDSLKDFELTKTQISKTDLVVISSTSRCSYESDLIEHLLLSETPYIKIEFDYNFCVRRNILCTLDRKIRHCCNTNKFHQFRNLFRGSKLNIFQSPRHYEAHYEFYGEAVSKHLIMPPTVSIEDLRISETKIENVIPFFGDLNYLKGGHAYLEYAESHPDLSFPVYGRNLLRQEVPKNVSFHDAIPNGTVLEILGKTKTLICQPVWPEPSGRLAAEAFLSGCEIIGNDRIGTFSFDFYPNDKPKAITEMKQALSNFWNEVEGITSNTKGPKTETLGKVLVYKSYGGLGDIFFAIPAIKKLVKVCDTLHFAVASRLVDFFKLHLKDVIVINEEIAKLQEKDFDNIYELGNYPAFRGYDLPHALKYPTHKKVKQHAIQHYIDTISKLHIDIDNSYDGYPYFEHSINEKEPYYVLHHGAGFLLKVWPTEKYAQLIEMLHRLFPNLKCKIIKGPEDPDIENHFTNPTPYIEYITGGMIEVGNAMSGALFHVGNDAGITHVAGAYNLPTVGIYGPTGPGSWGSFSEYNELIWGKTGVCNLRCNYDVILNCEHRICLNSITVDRVLAAVYKLLDKAYPKNKKIIKVNPNVVIDYGHNDCLLNLNGNEFLLEYHDVEMKNIVNDLLNERLPINTEDVNFKLIFDVLKQQNILFEVPTFE